GLGYDGHGAQAGHRLRRGRVAVSDAGGGVGAAQNARVQHALQVLVVAILGATGGLGGTIEALNLGADNPAWCWPWHGLIPPLIAKRVDGVPHLFIGAATADVARQPSFDLSRRGLGVLIEGRPHGDHETRRAEAALLGVVADESRG